MEEISLSELISYFLSKAILIIVITTNFTTGGLIYSIYFQTPMYRSETTLVLTHVSDEDNEAISQTDITLNRNLVSTYREIITSRTVLNEVIETLNLNYNSSQLASMISVTSVRDTEVIRISVSSPESREASDIANLLAEVFSESVLDIYSIRNIAIIDVAEVAQNPYNVDIVRQLAMYVALGLFSSLTLVFIMFGLDNTIKNEDEIANHLKLAILGVVPILKEGDVSNGE